MELFVFNPWWREGTISKTLVGLRRKVMQEILPYLDMRQILIFSGVRRVGKTTLMFQMIDELLSRENVNPYDILYFSFDEARDTLEAVLDEYEKTILKDSISRKARVVFANLKVDHFGGKR